MKKRIIGLVLGLFVLSLLVNAQVKIPEPYGYVNDFANIIPDDVEQQLEARLRAYEGDTSIEFAVVTVNSLEGLVIEDYTMRLAEKWKVGKVDKDNGVILLVAPNEKRLRIKPGYGLEGDLPDIICGRIIDNKIVPYFKQDDYIGGIVVGVDAVIGRLGTLSWEERLKQREEEERRQKEAAKKAGKIFLIVIISIAAIVLIVILMRAFIKEIEQARRRKELRRRAKKRCVETEESLNKTVELSRRVRKAFNSEIYLPRHIEHADSLVGGIHQRKNTVLSELKMAQAVLKKDPDIAFQHVSSAADALIEITDLIQEMENIQKSVEEAKKEAPGLVKKAAATIKEVQEKTLLIKKGGFRIKEFEPEANFAETASREPKDYELICSQAIGAINYAQGFLDGTMAKVNLRDEVAGSLKEIPKEIEILKEKIPAAQKELSELKGNNPGQVWATIEKSLRSVERLFKVVTAKTSQAAKLNSMQNQKFEAADFQITETEKVIKKIENSLSAPAEKLKKIAEAKASSGTLKPVLEEKISKAKRLIGDSDVGQTAKRFFRDAKARLDSVNALLNEGLVDWLVVVLLLKEAIELADKAIRKARQDTEDAEEERRRKRRREEEEQRSYHSSSSWSSGSGSSGGGFGGFGGGSFGGGGASGSW